MPNNQLKTEAIEAAQAAGMVTSEEIVLWARKHFRIGVSESMVKKHLSAQRKQHEVVSFREEGFTKQDIDYLHDLVNRIGTDKVRIIMDVFDQSITGGPRQATRRKS